MAQGRDQKLFISSDGTSTGTEVEVELQGDLTYNRGKTIQPTVYKNGQNSAINDGGENFAFQMGITAPLLAGQALMLAAADAEAKTYFWVRNAVTGGIEYAFEALVAVSAENMPINGDANAQIQLGVIGNVDRTVAA
jgi:hypothetical protein